MTDLESPEGAPKSSATEEPVTTGAEKRARRRTKPETPHARSGSGATVDTRELPFHAAYPNDPELQELVTAFEAGNYALVRREAPLLAERSTEPQVRAAARDLRRRIEPDSLARYIVLASFVLLAALTLIAYLRQGGTGP